MSKSDHPVKFFPMAGVVVYDGETDAQAFDRAKAAFERREQQRAEQARLEAWKNRPWWEDPPVDPNSPRAS